MATETGTAARDRAVRRQAQAQQHANEGGGGGLAFLLIAVGLGAFGVYELNKNKGATSAPPGVCAASDGTLVIEPVSGTIYVVHSGALSHVTSPAAFFACGYDPRDIKEISAAEVASCPAGPDVSGPPCPTAPTGVEACLASDGTLVRDTGTGAEYIVANNQLCHIVNPAVFVACGYNQNAINSYPSSVIAQCPLGPDVTGPPCPIGPGNPQSTLQ